MRPAARGVPDGRGRLLAWQVRKVRDYIDRHITGPVLVADLCALVQRSEAHFSRSFRGTFGYSPHAFVIRRRIEMAAAYMLNTDMSLSDIALGCGFVDQAHLCKHFRAARGKRRPPGDEHEDAMRGHGRLRAVLELRPSIRRERATARELDENTFDVGLHGLGGNLQLLSDAFIGKPTAHRAQNAVFARTQRLRDPRGTSRQHACTLLSAVRENASDVGSELRGQRGCPAGWRGKGITAVPRPAIPHRQMFDTPRRARPLEALVRASHGLRRVLRSEQSVRQLHRQAQGPVVASLAEAAAWSARRIAPPRHASPVAINSCARAHTWLACNVSSELNLLASVSARSVQSAASRVRPSFSSS